MEHLPPTGSAPDFEDIANELLSEGSYQSPAFLHGGMCGVYASAGDVAAEDCLAATAQALDLGLHGEVAESCLRLAEHTLAALQDEQFSFQLLLPDDDIEIEYRVQALSDWCRGFLAAYALMVPRESAAGLDSESGESIGDIAAIAEAAVDAEADVEESESHFYEISEYLRFATLNLFMNRCGDEESPGENPGDAGH